MYNITFVSLAKAADIPGKHRVSEAHTSLIHLKQGYNQLEVQWGGIGEAEMKTKGNYNTQGSHLQGQG